MALQPLLSCRAEMCAHFLIRAVTHINVNLDIIDWCHSLVCLVQFLITGTSPQKSIGARREQVPFSMTIENGELMHDCFQIHLRMGTARLK